MDDIFGIPLSSVLVALVVAFVLSLLAIGWIFWRRPVIFKAGVRNIPRRRAQSILILVGLMLSTMIISAALGTGDTVHHSLTNGIYQSYGNVDLLVVQSQQIDAPYIDRSTTIDASALELVDRSLAGNDQVDGIMPLLDAHMPVRNLSKQQSEPDVVSLGIDPSRLDAFGKLTSTTGKAIDFSAMPANTVVLSKTAADRLDASPGDTIELYYANSPHEVTVYAIGGDTFLTGYRRTREDYLEQPGLVMPLPMLQAITGQADTLSAIAISGAGSSQTGYEHSDSIKEALRPALAGSGLGVDLAKSMAVSDGERISKAFTSIFLVLGMFSVMAGVLLIILIFTMLAAERRSEMGISRAIGTQRRQLVEQFVSEGAGYAVIAGLVGSALGALATVGIARSMQGLFGQYASISPHVEARSLVVAYCLGVFITVLTVVAASWKIGRLDIVAAISDIPEAPRSRHTVRALLRGGLVLALATLMTVAGSSSDKAALFLSGLSMGMFGLAMILRLFRLPSRLVFSVCSLAVLAVWLLPEHLGTELWGTMDRGVEYFFVSGIFLVCASTILIMQNTSLVLSGVSRLGGAFKSRLPAVRMAVAYPGASRGRTGMTIAMFSLIIFSLVMLATINQNYSALYSSAGADAGWDIRIDTAAAGTVTDLETMLQASGWQDTEFTATGIVTNPGAASSEVRLSGTPEWKKWPVLGMNDAFIGNTTFAFSQRAVGYDDDSDVTRALREDPNVAVIDALALPAGADFGGDNQLFALTGLRASDRSFQPIEIDLVSPSGNVQRVSIIGIIDSKISTLHGIFANQRTIDAIYPHLGSASYYVSLPDTTQAPELARSIESALFEYGAQAVPIRQELRDAQKEESGFLYLIEGFMGLGLLVGAAAVGVIAFRSVLERRQQIGVLRAIGFPRGSISLSFLIETGFVVGMGVLAGTTLGILLARGFFLSSDGAAGNDARFSVPVVLISLIVITTAAIALLMTWMPARQASRISPAEALRYQ